MIKTYLFALLALVTSMAVGQNFRGFSWGESKRGVIAKEGAPTNDLFISISPNTVKYDSKVVAGNYAATYFFFSYKEGLVHGYYVMRLTTTPVEAIINTLTRKHGNPKKFMNQLNLQEYHWKNDKTMITLYSGGGLAWLHYYSLPHYLLLEKIEQEKEEEGL